MNDEFFMQQALAAAHEALQHDEVPIGAVLVKDDEVITRGFNQSISLLDPTAHAEIQVLREGAHALQNYRLLDTTLYVTLEPCAMCLGAMIHARVKRIVFGAPDPKTGVLGGAMHLSEEKCFNHRIAYEGGVLEESCGKLLKDFFKERRGI